MLSGIFFLGVPIVSWGCLVFVGRLCFATFPLFHLPLAIVHRHLPRLQWLQWHAMTHSRRSKARPTEKLEVAVVSVRVFQEYCWMISKIHKSYIGKTSGSRQAQDVVASWRLRLFFFIFHRLRHVGRLLPGQASLTWHVWGVYIMEYDNPQYIG